VKIFAVLARDRLRAALCSPARSRPIRERDARAFVEKVTMTARSTSCEAAWSQCHGQHWPRQIRKDGSRHWL